MYRGLGGAVNGVEAEGHKGHGGTCEEQVCRFSCAGEAHEVRDEEACEKDRRRKVGGDLGSDASRCAGGGVEEREGLLDAGVEEDGVEGWESPEDLGDVGGEVGEVGDIPLRKGNEDGLVIGILAVQDEGILKDMNRVIPCVSQHLVALAQVLTACLYVCQQ